MVKRDTNSKIDTKYVSSEAQQDGNVDFLLEGEGFTEYFERIHQQIQHSSSDASSSHSASFRRTPSENPESLDTSPLSPVLSRLSSKPHVAAPASSRTAIRRSGDHDLRKRKADENLYGEHDIKRRRLVRPISSGTATEKNGSDRSEENRSKIRGEALYLVASDHPLAAPFVERRSAPLRGRGGNHPGQSLDPRAKSHLYREGNGPGGGSLSKEASSHRGETLPINPRSSGNIKTEKKGGSQRAIAQSDPSAEINKRHLDRMSRSDGRGRD